MSCACLVHRQARRRRGRGRGIQLALEELRGRLYDRIMGKIDFSREMPDSEILDLIDEEIVGESFAHGMELSDMKKLRRELFYSIRKLDVLQELLDDPAITEIMINNSDSIFIERDGAITPYPQHFASPQKLDDVIQAIVSACNRTVNAGDPIADARLPGGERVNVVLPPISLGGPTVTIRRFPDDPIRMKDLIRFGSVSQEAAEFLQRLVCAGCNIFISGGTGSGKTTFLNALSDYIPESERIITIEDNAELQIRHIPNLVRLEARSAGPGGCSAITIRDLIRTSLRMRPDRIIVGEVRGSEAIDMLQAMNTGHDGSMSTGHANSAKDMIARLETMCLESSVPLPIQAVRGQIASGLDFIVHLGRIRDRTRKMLEIDEVLGMKNGEVELEARWKFEESGEKDGRVIGEFKKYGEIRHRDKFAAAGISPE